jgi:Ecdysteroid kinase-like family
MKSATVSDLPAANSTGHPLLLKTREQITPRWLTAVLQKKHILRPAETVHSLQVDIIGTGQMGCVARLTPRYDADSRSAPETLIAKLATTNETSRRTSNQLGLYEAEVRFYQGIASSVDIRIPQCWFADFEPEEGHFTLLLEDLNGYEIGDVLQPGSLKKAQFAIRELVKLHTSRWDDPELQAMEWLSAPRFEQIFAHFPKSLEGFVELFRSKLDPALIALAERLLPKSLDYVARWQGPKVIQHGDYRLDNMVFGQSPEHSPVVVLDWQTVSLGPPMVDLAYYLGSGLSIAHRRNHERILLKDYHQKLIDAGIDNYSWEDCWNDYRLHSMFGFFLTTGMSVLVGDKNERSMAMFEISTRHHGAHVLDLRADELL